MAEVFQAVFQALSACTPEDKVRKTQAIFKSWKNDSLDVGPPVTPPAHPGKPDLPELVPPNSVPRRRIGSTDGRAALMHAVAHIEFNAINLALDMTLRFGPSDEFITEFDQISFIGDWLSVANDEARHFSLLSSYLAQHGFKYGDFKAHNGLWEAAEQTESDIAARLAIAPMVLEARGLDVTPQMISRFEKIGDKNAVNILSTILEEEIPHVAFGTKWFGYFSSQRGKDSEKYFHEQVRSYFKGKLKPPFNDLARAKAGLFEEYYLPLI